MEEAFSPPRQQLWALPHEKREQLRPKCRLSTFQGEAAERVAFEEVGNRGTMTQEGSLPLKSTILKGGSSRKTAAEEKLVLTRTTSMGGSHRRTCSKRTVPLMKPTPRGGSRGTVTLEGKPSLTLMTTRALHLWVMRLTGESQRVGSIQLLDV